jgi:hypothetical protein
MLINVFNSYNMSISPMERDFCKNKQANKQNKTNKKPTASSVG